MCGINMILNEVYFSNSSRNIVAIKEKLENYKSILSKYNNEYKKINYEIELLRKLFERYENFYDDYLL